MARNWLGTLLPYVLLTLVSITPTQSQAQTCSPNDLVSRTNQVYTTCNVFPSLNSYFYWSFFPSTNVTNIAFRKSSASASNWVAWAINPTGKKMAGSQAIVAFRHSNGSVLAYTSPVAGYGTKLEEGSLSFGVTDVTAEFSGGEMVVFATLSLTGGLLSTNHLWQEGPVTGDVPQAHSFGAANLGAVGTIDFQTGATSVGGGSGSNTKKKNVHGVLNAVSWGVLMPMGAMVARYLKVFQVANPAWFYLHAGTQTMAYGVGVAGWATGISLGKDSGITRTKHRDIGIALFALGTLQLFALLLRPKPDHKLRFYWNIYHHTIGYTVIVLSIVNVYEGLDILDPEKKWKRIYTGTLIFLGAVALTLLLYTFGSVTF
uniref:Expressed protein 2 n=1 Tax=Hypericum perforatum TaxID=65561 RepID=D9ZHD4_HYPPE|nr:expressed protein 2 [Hypericum perforatum]